MCAVLHLYPARCDFQTQRSIELLSKDRIGGISMTAMSIGPGGDFINLPHAVISLRFSRRPHSDIVHAWGPRELIAAAALGFSHIIFSPQAPMDRTWLPWINLVLRRRRVEIVCPTAAMRNVFVERGMPGDRCHVITPGVDFDRLAGSNTRIRADLGLADSDLVLLAPGESTSEMAHREAIWSAGILSFLDGRYRLLTWGRGPCVQSLMHFARSTRQEHLVTYAEQRLGRPVDFEQLIPAADAAIVSAGTLAPTLPVFICMAGGLPVVAVKTAASVEFLEDNVNALMESSATPRALAQRVLDLQKDGALRQRITQVALTAARERYSAARFIQNWKSFYGRLAARSVPVPRPAPAPLEARTIPLRTPAAAAQPE
jgi:glycosyltransferase involved in cell wall biosynthesis